MKLMRNMSFMLTTNQFNNRSKTVTRRIGWWFLKPGDRLMGVEKSQGIKPGEKIVKLHEIEVVSVHPESLNMMETYGRKECEREGFLHMSAPEFVAMFCKHMKCTPHTLVNRIEFKHL